MIIGLTGNICAGKSTVLKYFSESGCAVMSADKIAHGLLAKNAFVRKKVDKYFGTTDRKELGEIVFADCHKRILLETILHPEINKVITEELRKLKNEKIVVIEIPLLFETGWEKNVDYTVFVSCPTEIRKGRFLKGRKSTIGDFECRDTAQLNEANKTRLASFVIDNSDSLAKTKKAVKEILNQIK